MKRYFILLSVLLAAAACRQAEDTRYFAPAVEFGSDLYAVTAGDGGLDVDLHLSRPASQAFQILLNISSSLEEGVQWSASRNVDITVGQQDAKLHIDLKDDEIWVESAWIDILLKPGERYTVDPARKSSARVEVSKTILLPILSLVRPEEEIVTNPFLGETLRFTLQSDREPREDVNVVLDFDGLAYGTDYRIPGWTGAGIVLPAGKTSQTFDVEIIRKDLSGYDRQAQLAVIPQKGVYSVAPDGESVPVRLTDPVVPLKPLWKTAALNGGTGYRWNQAIKTPAGGWDGNTSVDMWLSADGSNYVQSQRSLWTHTSFSCPATASPSHLFRLTDLCPRLRHPNDVIILDYGANESYRSFFPCDSLFRFVPDRLDDLSTGSLVMPSPRMIYAYIGDRVEWGNAWKEDAVKTGGDMAASTHPAIQGKVYVTLERMEGRYDLNEKVLFITAWFSSEDERFMQDVDFGKWAISEEDGLWKVDYKLWPR